MTSDELLQQLIESLAAEGLPRAMLENMEARCVEWVGQMRTKRRRDLDDVAIAQLIPHGVDKVQERFGTSERTGFRRAARGRSLLKTAAILPVGIGS